MARVAIAEPNEEIRELVSHIVAGLGHVPVAVDEPDLDALVLEPAGDGAVELVTRLRHERPALPLVVVSIFEPTRETRALAPVAHLRKPFRVAELERAIGLAVRWPEDLR